MRKQIRVLLDQDDAARMRQSIQGVLNMNDLDQGLKVARQMEAALVETPLSILDIVIRCLRPIINGDTDLLEPEQQGFDLVVMVPVTELFGSDDAAKDYINGRALQEPYYDLGSSYEIVGFTHQYSKRLVEQFKRSGIDLPVGAEYGQCVYINIRHNLAETLQQIAAVDGLSCSCITMEEALKALDADAEQRQKVADWLKENNLSSGFYTP